MTVEDALKWIADLFEFPFAQIAVDTPRDQIETWDSLGMLTLMARLDSDFSILLSDDEIQNFKSVKDIIEIFSRNGKLNNKP